MEVSESLSDELNQITLISQLQMIVSKYGSQFRGNSQHDALEFLLWLLDRIHEDVNSSLLSPCGNNRIKSSGKVSVGTMGFHETNLGCTLRFTSKAKDMQVPQDSSHTFQVP